MCFIDIGGAENARVVKGAAAPAALLPSDETTPSFHRKSELTSDKPKISH